MTISDAEGHVMEVLWRRSPLGTDEIAKALEGQQDWQLATVKTLGERIIPPTLGYGVPDPECDLDYVPDEARPLVLSNGRPAAAISNSFAFGGHNVALVIKGPPTSSRS